MVTDAKLTYNEITDKLIDDDFLDCFEKNDISIIYNKSCEAIIHDLFRKECSYSEEIDPVVYIRFASVYKSFDSLEDFKKFIEN